MSELDDLPDVDLPGRLPGGKRKRSGSYLSDESSSMDRARRLIEQQGHRQHQQVRVHAREHAEEWQKPAPEGELQNGVLLHPELDRQCWDGEPPNLSVIPSQSIVGDIELENLQREQEKEKQLRLGNMPKFSTAPKPRGP